jgi:hypothetical protein
MKQIQIGIHNLRGISYGYLEQQYSTNLRILRPIPAMFLSSLFNQRPVNLLNNASTQI